MESFRGRFPEEQYLPRPRAGLSDTRSAALFLCPGTGIIGNPPQLCHASASNASIANDEDIYTAEVPIH